MNRSRKYNLITQQFIANYEDIPLMRQNSKTDKKCNVSVAVFNTDYMQSFFEMLDVSNLYAVFILASKAVFPDSDFSVVSKYNCLNTNIVIAKIDFEFFKDLDYNSRHEIEKAFFFRSDSFEELNVNEILKECLYERGLVIGDFKKNIVTIDPLQLLNNKLIKTVSKFYVDRTEASLENTLNLKDFVLDENEDYISKIEISLIND